MTAPWHGPMSESSGAKDPAGKPARGRIVMLGSSHRNRRPGGIRSVIEMYRKDGLFERWNIRFIGTHERGGAARKVLVACAAWLTFMALLLLRKVDLVHAHTSIKTSFWRKCLFMIPAFLVRVPVVLHLHGGGFVDFYDQCGPLRRRVVRGVLDRADTVIVLTDTWRRKLERCTDNKRIVTIHNPVATDLLDCRKHGERENPALLFLGMIAANKGIFELLDAVDAVRKEFPGVRLRCGGIGDIPAVRARILELGLEEQVTLLGWIEGEEKDARLCQASVMVLPSHWEGLPMTLLEAMSQGIPVVSTAVGGIPDAVRDGVDGLLVPAGDREALAEALRTVLGNDALRTAMGRQARERVLREFSLQEVMPRLDQLYLDLGMGAHRRWARDAGKNDAVREGTP